MKAEYFSHSSIRSSTNDFCFFFILEWMMSRKYYSRRFIECFSPSFWSAWIKILEVQPYLVWSYFLIWQQVGGRTIMLSHFQFVRQLGSRGRPTRRPTTHNTAKFIFITTSHFDLMRQRVYETAGANTYRVPENDMSICMKLYLMAIMLLCVHRSVPKQKICWETQSTKWVSWATFSCIPHSEGFLTRCLVPRSTLKIEFIEIALWCKRLIIEPLSLFAFRRYDFCKWIVPFVRNNKSGQALCGLEACVCERACASQSDYIDLKVWTAFYYHL